MYFYTSLLKFALLNSSMLYQLRTSLLINISYLLTLETGRTYSI